MNKREIRARLKTLDKVEKQWRTERFKEWDTRECYLCVESFNITQGDPDEVDECSVCTATISGFICTTVVDVARRRNSIRPITDAIRKMRKYLKGPED
jgi:hypothetical protein